MYLTAEISLHTIASHSISSPFATLMFFAFAQLNFFFSFSFAQQISQTKYNYHTAPYNLFPFILIISIINLFSIWDSHMHEEEKNGK